VIKLNAPMLALLAVYFVLTFLLTLSLGYLQTPYCVTGEAQHSGKMESILAIIAVCVQALVSIILLKGTVWFPFSALFLSFTLLCHHAVIHRNSRFDDETCSCTPFQCKDVSNHETWVVASSVAAVISLLHL
jgi:hypothetical protein